MSLLGTRSLTVEVGGNTVCRGLDLTVMPGDIVAILGANGIGKTTLLHTLAGLREAAGGEVLLDGEPLRLLSPRRRAKRLGVVFQDHEDPLHANVLQTVLSGRHPHLAPFRGESAEDRDIAMEALRRTGLEDRARSPLDILSGGERKRVALAALLAQRPAVCLLDEPNTHLDLHHQVSALSLVCEHVADCRGSAVMVLHDVNLALRFCRSALLLFGGGDTVHGPVDEVLDSRVLGRLYGHPMREFRDGEARCFVPA